MWGSWGAERITTIISAMDGMDHYHGVPRVRQGVSMYGFELRTCGHKLIVSNNIFEFNNIIIRDKH